MITEIEIFNVKEKQSFEMRIGVNLVTAVARVLGTKNFIYDLWWGAVNIAPRIKSTGLASRRQIL